MLIRGLCGKEESMAITRTGLVDLYEMQCMARDDFSVPGLRALEQALFTQEPEHYELFAHQMLCPGCPRLRAEQSRAEQSRADDSSLFPSVSRGW